MTEVLTLVFDAFISLLLVLTIVYCWVLNRRIRVLQDSRSELAQLIRHFDMSTEKASASIVSLQSASKKIGEVIQERVEKANFMADDLAFLIEKASKSADQLEKDLAEYRHHRKQVAEDNAAGGARRPVARSLHQAALQASAPRATSQEFAPASRGPAMPRPAEPVVPSQPQRSQASATAHETLAVIQQRAAKVAEAVANENEVPGQSKTPASARARTNATLETLLQRMADRQEEEAGAAGPGENAVPSASARLLPNKKRMAATEPKPESADADRPRSRAEQELLDIIKAGSRV